MVIMQLALIRESDMRSKLVRKLSEANQHIRQLKKEVQVSLQSWHIDCNVLHSSAWEVTNVWHYMMAGSGERQHNVQMPKWAFKYGAGASGLIFSSNSAGKKWHKAQDCHFSQSSVSCFILRSSKYACLVPGACEHSSRNCQGRRQTWNPKNQWTLYSFPSCIQTWRWWHLLTSIYLYVKSYILLSKRRLSHLELSFDGKVMGACCKSEMQKLIFARIKDVDMVRTREVDLVYYGMAEVSPLVKSFVTL